MSRRMRIAALVAGLLCSAQAAGPAGAAELTELSPARAVEAATAPPQGGPGVAREAVGAIVHVVDNFGQLATVQIGTSAVRIIGSMGVRMIDIGFDPNGNLFGLDGTSFYRIDRRTARATRVGFHGIPNGSGLVCASRGKCYGTGNFTTNLYEIDVRTGRSRVLGQIGGYTSAGDLAFYRGNFVFSTNSRVLVTLDRRNGQVLNAVGIPVSGVFGLSSISDVIYGFAGTAGYRISPETGATTLAANFPGRGLSYILGAAYSVRAQR